MDKVEKVARAIWEQRRKHSVEENGIELEAWGERIMNLDEGEVIAIRNGIMEEARAAIDAVSEDGK